MLLEAVRNGAKFTAAAFVVYQDQWLIGCVICEGVCEGYVTGCMREGNR